MTWTLADIRQKVRQVSGRLSLNELSNNELDAIINQYVTYEFPAEVKLDRLLTNYEFNTVRYTESYTQPETYTNFIPDAYIDNYRLYFYQDVDQFNELYVNPFSRVTIGTGDGATLTFTATLMVQNYIRPGSVIVDDLSEAFTDNGNGTLSGDQGGSGTINYATGALSVTFNAAPASTVNIQCSFYNLTVGRPVAVLMYNNQFTFYPTPDRVYRFRIAAYTINSIQSASGTIQSSFISATDRPLKDQWGPAIAYGSARRLHADYGEMEQYAQVTALYKEQLGYVLTRTLQNQMEARAKPMF